MSGLSDLIGSHKIISKVMTWCFNAAKIHDTTDFTRWLSSNDQPESISMLADYCAQRQLEPDTAATNSFR